MAAFLWSGTLVPQCVGRSAVILLSLVHFSPLITWTLYRRDIPCVHQRGTGSTATGRFSGHQRTRMWPARWRLATVWHHVRNLIYQNFHSRWIGCEGQVAFAAPRPETHRFIFVGTYHGKHLPISHFRNIWHNSPSARCCGYGQRRYVADRKRIYRLKSE